MLSFIKNAALAGYVSAVKSKLVSISAINLLKRARSMEEVRHILRTTHYEPYLPPVLSSSTEFEQAAMTLFENRFRSLARFAYAPRGVHALHLVAALYESMLVGRALSLLSKGSRDLVDLIPQFMRVTKKVLQHISTQPHWVVASKLLPLELITPEVIKELQTAYEERKPYIDCLLIRHALSVLNLELEQLLPRSDYRIVSRILMLRFAVQDLINYLRLLRQNLTWEEIENYLVAHHVFPRARLRPYNSVETLAENLPELPWIRMIGSPTIHDTSPEGIASYEITLWERLRDRMNMMFAKNRFSLSIALAYIFLLECEIRLLLGIISRVEVHTETSLKQR